MDSIIAMVSSYKGLSEAGKESFPSKTDQRSPPSNGLLARMPTKASNGKRLLLNCKEDDSELRVKVN